MKILTFMEKEFVPYEESLELKQLGFDEPCFGIFTIDKTLLEKVTWMPNQTECETYFGGILAPLYQQAFRWFRETHNLHVNKTGNAYYTSFSMIEPKNEILTFVRYTDTENHYEEAELACLKKLIQIVKNK